MIPGVPTVVCGVVSNEKGEILIAQRRKPIDGINYWEFPGGKVEKGETLFQALIREWNEEFEIDIKPKKHLTSISHPRFLLEFIRGETLESPKALNSHLAYKWLTLKQLTTLPDESSHNRIQMLVTNVQFINEFIKPSI
jgi:8-oxo-dGTP diphosphatase